MSTDAVSSFDRCEAALHELASLARLPVRSPTIERAMVARARRLGASLDAIAAATGKVSPANRVAVEIRLASSRVCWTGPSRGSSGFALPASNAARLRSVSTDDGARRDETR